MEKIDISQVFKPKTEEQPQQTSETESLGSFKQRYAEWARTELQQKPEYTSWEMQMYEDEWPEFLKDGWSFGAIHALMAMGG
ncbi:MAG: hypothetical protein HUJ66_05440 [Oscillospiraceae bacterium]|nr:hypothetical protein [Oscillospiraceae bacterium]